MLMISEYEVGRVSVKSGSDLVAGRGTSWLTYVKAGDTLEIAGTQQQIAEVIDVSTLRLAQPYVGQDLTDVHYKITIT